MYRMSRLNDAEERNRARVLLEHGVDDPITSMRNAKYRVLGNLLKGGLLATAAGAGLGGIVGYANGKDGDRGNAAGGGALAGAIGLGAAHLLVSAMMAAAGSVSGNISRTDPQRIADFYSGRDRATPYRAAYAGAQLDKAVQDRQARHQTEAPYQIVQ